MPVFRLGRIREEYNAGLDFCEKCGRSRRHTLLFSHWRLEVLGRQLDWRRRWATHCGECGLTVRLAEPPDLEEIAARVEEAEVAASRSPAFMELANRMDRLLSPRGLDERQQLLQQAHPGLHGLLLEYARVRARELTRALVPAWAPAALRDQSGPLGGRSGDSPAPAAAQPEPAELERALESSLFHAATAGYLLYHVAASQGLSAAPPAAGLPRRDPQDAASFARIAGPRAAGRAERGKHATDPDVAAWVWEQAGTQPAALAENGLALPTALHPPVVRAARACLFYGLAVGAEEALLTR